MTMTVQGRDSQEKKLIEKIIEKLIEMEFSVSIQDTLYALYTILHHGAPPKYYKYYIVLNFILSATFPSKLC